MPVYMAGIRKGGLGDYRRVVEERGLPHDPRPPMSVLCWRTNSSQPFNRWCPGSSSNAEDALQGPLLRDTR